MNLTAKLRMGWNGYEVGGERKEEKRKNKCHDFSWAKVGRRNVQGFSGMAVAKAPGKWLACYLGIITFRCSGGKDSAMEEKE